ncbi:hypothetical protein [Pseudoalteromonas sp. OANN1]|uniref:hypothetical protein n=1 Tax=Pseudoalteromonas sp. OANN1 TaxID=2954497 RepID=UPI002097B029|nr:hypothetical protein [Pseudoalteromonas sp. OANN1]MCO7197577.1 hypothetical protein [Pseudoalteromonas sp. OANN1]
MMQNFRDTDSGDGFLYHYTSIDTACDYILKDNRLLLNSLHKANAPKDCKTWFLSAYTNDHERYGLKHGLRAAEELKKVVRMTCFTQDQLQENPPSKIILDINRCEFNNPQMCHYYGKANTGVCLK